MNLWIGNFLNQLCGRELFIGFQLVHTFYYLVLISLPAPLNFNFWSVTENKNSFAANRLICDVKSSFLAFKFYFYISSFVP